MAENTFIEWADHTFNPWYGCSKISPGCDRCYAEARMDTRLHRVQWGAGQPRVRTKDWSGPERWNRQHQAFYAAHGRRQRVFCASLADVFDNQVPDEWRADLFDLIDATPNLDWLLLTKRIGNVVPMLKAARRLRHGIDSQGIHVHPRPNVWLGATIVNQEEAARDIPKLLATPARVRFLSMEPLLGPVQLREEWLLGSFDRCAEEDADSEVDGCRGCPGHGRECHAVRGPRLHWVIVGGESGAGARPMHPDWARSLRDQCATAGVPFLFKQWGEHSLQYDRDRDDPDYRRCDQMARKPGRWINLAGGHGFNGERVHYAERIGKKAAGRLLDGVTHDGFPEVR